MTGLVTAVHRSSAPAQQSFGAISALILEAPKTTDFGALS
jgi:hypothetical protein